VTAEPSLPDKVVALDAALEAAGLPHAFGGALALAYYGEPRVTVDVDLNVFVPAARHPEVGAALEPLGVVVPAVAVEVGELARHGQLRARWGRTPVDLFYAYAAIHDAMRTGTRREPFGDATIPVLGPEHLVVCKVVFDRAKDWLDVAQVLVGVEGFDVGEVRRWLDAVVGPGDPRRARFDRLEREVLGG
jgi:hypothetical protein